MWQSPNAAGTTGQHWESVWVESMLPSPIFTEHSTCLHHSGPGRQAGIQTVTHWHSLLQLSGKSFGNIQPNSQENQYTVSNSSTIGCYEQYELFLTFCSIPWGHTKLPTMYHPSILMAWTASHQWAIRWQWWWYSQLVFKVFPLQTAMGYPKICCTSVCTESSEHNQVST